MMDRNFIYMLFVALILQAGSFAYSAHIEIDLIHDLEIGKDAVFVIKINNAPNDISSFGFDLQFNSDLFVYQGFERGELITNGFSFFNLNKLSSDNLRVAGIEPGNNILVKGSSGVLLKIVFNVISRAKTVVRLENLKDDIRNWIIQNIQIEYEKTISFSIQDFGGDGKIGLPEMIHFLKIFVNE